MPKRKSTPSETDIQIADEKKAQSSKQMLEDQIVHWYLSGMSAPQIAKKDEVSCTPLSILNLLRRKGVEVRSRGSYASEITDKKMIDNMITDYKDNQMSFHALSVKYNKNANTIYYHLKKHDLSARKYKKLNESSLMDIMKQYEKDPTSKTLDAMAKKYEVTKNAIKYHLKKRENNNK